MGRYGGLRSLGKRGSESATDRGSAPSRLGARARPKAAEPAPTRRFARVAVLSSLVLLAIYTAAAAEVLSRPSRSELERLIWLGAPLVIAFLLAGLLLIEARRVERAHAAFNDSERRFRMAVEAARCGIWEWDL